MFSSTPSRTRSSSVATSRKTFGDTRQISSATHLRSAESVSVVARLRQDSKTIHEAAKLNGKYWKTRIGSEVCPISESVQRVVTFSMWFRFATLRQTPLGSPDVPDV